MNGAEAKPLVPEPVGIDHPLVVRHTQRIVSLKRSRAEWGAEVAVEIGQRLADVKGKLAYGLWGRWLREHVQFTHASSVRYMRIAEFATSDFKSFEKCKSLGPNKLFALSQLSPQGRAKLLSRDVHSVGATAVPKTLARMTLAEFGALARSFDGGVRTRSPRVREFLRSGSAAAERVCHVLRRLAGRRLPESSRSERFKTLLRELYVALESCPYVTAPKPPAKAVPAVPAQR